VSSSFVERFAFGYGDGEEDDFVDREPRQMPPWFRRGLRRLDLTLLGA
jgi:hypothetical protein